jgi:hypothetical protein
MEMVAGLFGILFIFTAAGMIGSASAADIWYVSSNGSDINGGTGWDDAFATIQKGVDTAQEGDTVLVADGTYTGPGNKNISLGYRNMTICSANGPRNCIIDLENDGKGFVLDWANTAATCIDGFTIMNGNPGDVYNYGVGISCTTCGAIIRNCIIKNHSGVQWGAGIDVRFRGQPVIVNSIFTGNRSTVGGSAVSVYQDSPAFINCTFFDNSGGHSVVSATPTTSFTNCIFWNNDPETDFIRGDPSVTYSDVENGYGGKILTKTLISTRVSSIPTAKISGSLTIPTASTPVTTVRPASMTGIWTESLASSTAMAI